MTWQPGSRFESAIPVRFRGAKWLAASLAVMGAAACTGEIGSGVPAGIDPDGPGKETQVACSATTIGASPLRRLTRWELNNTVFDLLGDATKPADQLDKEAVNFGFDNNVAGAILNVSVVEDYETIAIGIAGRATSDVNALLGCDPAVEGEAACVASFVETFGKKAFRRPLTQEEKQAYTAFVATNLSDFGLADTVRMVVSAMLQSPHFLYRVEVLGPNEVAGDNVQLDPYEMAARLSYMLWGSMPDETLLEAADKGELETPEQIATQAKRMISDEKGSRVIKNFMSQWSSMINLANETRPELTPEIADLLTREFEVFSDHVVREGDGRLGTLLSAPYTYMNETLADYYGMSGPTGDAFVKVDLDPTKYAGFLTQAGLMSLKAHPDQHSSVSRGVFVLEQLLCAPPPPPPDDADLTLPEVSPNTTSRERLETKTSVAPCSGCHALINPLGYAFEHFDQHGRYRETEGELPIDSSGQLSLGGEQKPFSGATELGALLSTSTRARECFVDHWFRYAYGRNFTEADQCARETLAAQFELTEGNVRELLVALTQTPTFLFRAGGTQ